MAVSELITGLQHIGIPTNDLEKTIAFYTGLGFEKTYETINGNDRVAFLRLAGVTIETYQNGLAVGQHGAIDHIAFDVNDLEAMVAFLKAGDYTILEPEIQSLPFWENGITYINILGPNGEKLEFSQML